MLPHSKPHVTTVRRYPRILNIYDDALQLMEKESLVEHHPFTVLGMNEAEAYERLQLHSDLESHLLLQSVSCLSLALSSQPVLWVVFTKII
jgi:hypothetical protein